jgi:uncharacterized protein
MPNNNPRGHNQYTRSEDRSTGVATSATDASAAQPLGLENHGSPDTASVARPPSGISRRGFASMDEQTQREIASKGGHSQGRDNNPGNFANDRDKAREAGRKGGEANGANANR